MHMCIPSKYKATPHMPVETAKCPMCGWVAKAAVPSALTLKLWISLNWSVI